MEKLAYARFTFRDFTGYLLNPGNAQHDYLTICHSASVPPWNDMDVHMHEESEEYFLLLQGAFVLMVNDSLLSLQPGEIMMIKPKMPHAIVHGSGLIEHFGFRAPAVDDRRSLGLLTSEFPNYVDAGAREIRSEWGYRVPLYEPINKNCWSIGYGDARFPSSHFSLAFLDFPTHQEANAGIGSRHRVHLHQESWEYYVVLEGSKTLQIEGQEVSVAPGEMLEVPPGVRHTLLGRLAPYVGFTFRVPLRNDKVEF